MDSENARLRALDSLAVLDTAPEPAFDAIVKLASELCEAPIALVSLVDHARQWFKARTGIEVTETPREHAFCSHALEVPAGLIVPDAQRDERFADNPLVTGRPGIRFYAGIPLRIDREYVVGTLCVIDTRPRELGVAQLRNLSTLARQAEQLLELRRAHVALRALRSRERELEHRLRTISEHESQRLASEVHDGVGQDLIAIGLAMRSLRRELGDVDPAIDGEIARIRTLVETAVVHCRDIAYGQAAFLVHRQGFVDALQAHCARLSEFGGTPLTLATVTVREDGLSQQVGYHLLRIAQEAIANARRHSGATHIAVEVEQRAGLLMLAVEDDGLGLTEPARSEPGVGLRSMMYRAQEIDARLQFLRGAAGGLRVECTLPLAGTAPGGAQ